MTDQKMTDQIWLLGSFLGDPKAFESTQRRNQLMKDQTEGAFGVKFD